MKNLILLFGALTLLSACYSSGPHLNEDMCQMDEDCDDGNPRSADVCREGDYGWMVCMHITPFPDPPDTTDTLPGSCVTTDDCPVNPLSPQVCRDGRCVSATAVPGGSASMHEICDNGEDDDGNSLIDCDDPFCATFDGC